MCRSLTFVIAGLFALGVLLSSTPNADASIQTFTIGANSEVSNSGGYMPGSAVVTFDDGGTAGTVTLTMDLTNWVGGDGASTAYAQGFYFSFSSNTLSLSDLTFAYDSGQQGITDGMGNPVFIPAGTFDGQGDFFPWSIHFESSNSMGGVNRFTAGETSVYTISGDGLTANDFYDGSNVPDDWQAGVRARGLNGTFDEDGDPIPDGGGSGWFTGGDGQIPEPTSFAIWGMLGITGVAMSSRRRRSR